MGFNYSARAKCTKNVQNWFGPFGVLDIGVSDILVSCIMVWDSLVFGHFAIALQLHFLSEVCQKWCPVLLFYSSDFIVGKLKL
jgi:hypothetical protein